MPWAFLFRGPILKGLAFAGAAAVAVALFHSWQNRGAEIQTLQGQLAEAANLIETLQASHSAELSLQENRCRRDAAALKRRTASANRLAARLADLKRLPKPKPPISPKEQGHENAAIVCPVDPAIQRAFEFLREDAAETGAGERNHYSDATGGIDPLQGPSPDPG